jgi:hypothetical protein
MFYWVKNFEWEIGRLMHGYIKDLKRLQIKLITQKQELRFRKSKLINHKSVNYVSTFISQNSAYFSFPIIFQYIYQRQEYVGSEVTSSSEDG